MGAAPRFRERTGVLTGECGSFGTSVGSFIRSLRGGPVRKSRLDPNVHGVELTVISGKGNGSKKTHIVACAVYTSRDRNHICLISICSGSSFSAMDMSVLGGVVSRRNVV